MKPNRILVLGGSGMLGSAVIPELRAAGMEILAPLETELDITDFPGVSECVKQFQPRAIVNCAGFTKVDECETRRELCFKVNGEAPGNLARAAQMTGTLLLHISSDYIFKGDKDDEYLEIDAPGPLNFYGKSKLFGEEQVRKETERYCIIRTSWLFGPGGENFVTKLLKKAGQGVQQLKVVADERGRPTFTRDLARVIRFALEKELTGIYHVCNQGAVSWLEYAREIFAIRGEGPELVPVTAEQYGLPAKRPKNSTLATGKIEKTLGFSIRHHREALAEYMVETGLAKPDGEKT